MKRLTKIFQALLGVVALILTAFVAVSRLALRTICKWWRRSKCLRYSVVVFSILIPLGFVAHVATKYYEYKYGRDYLDRRLSDKIILHSFADGECRVFDCIKDEYTTDKINWVSDVPVNDSMAVYAKSGKRGYINVNTGSITIDADANGYHKAWVFSDGLAAVMKDGKIGFINAANEVVIPFLFDYTDKCRMWDFGYAFHNGYCAMPDANGDLGLIDKSGNWVVESAYDEIWAPNKNGYRIVIKDHKYGILDSIGTVVYPAEYVYATILKDGFVLTKGGKQWQVDFEGNTVQPFMFDGTYYLKYPNGYDSCGDLTYEFADFVKYEVMNSYGIMNRITGEPITPAIYSDINMLSKNLFEVQEYDSYDWYLLDTKGNVVSRTIQVDK